MAKKDELNAWLLEIESSPDKIERLEVSGTAIAYSNKTGEYVAVPDRFKELL